MTKLVKFFYLVLVEEFAFFKKTFYLCTLFRGGHVAQLVEHIPFKDGALGSSPSVTTKTNEHQIQIPVFHLFFDCMPVVCVGYRAGFRVLSVGFGAGGYRDRRS